MHSLNQPIHPSIVQPPNLANHHGHRHSHSLVPISLVYIHIRITRSRSVRFGCDLCERWARVMSIGPFTVVHITRTLLVLIGPMVLCRLLEATDLVLFCLPTPLGALSLSDFCAPRGKFTLNTTIVSIAGTVILSFIRHVAMICCYSLVVGVVGLVVGWLHWAWTSVASAPQSSRPCLYQRIEAWNLNLLHFSCLLCWRWWCLRLLLSYYGDCAQTHQTKPFISQIHIFDNTTSIILVDPVNSFPFRLCLQENVI